MKIIFSVTAVVCISVGSYGQLPSNDPAWILQTSNSEEFNAPLDTVNKWYPRYSWGGANNGAEWNYPANLIMTGTTLRIKADTLVPHRFHSPSPFAMPDNAGVSYAYQSGAIMSRPVGGLDPYKFGYIEVNAKFPTSCYPLWPALWVFGCEGGQYNEIDYVENPANISYNGHQTTYNRWVKLTECNSADLNNDMITVSGLPLLSAAFHKYGVEWSPDRINFYFDDVLKGSFYDPSGATIPQHRMPAIINFCIDPWYAFLPSDWNDTLYFGPDIAHGNAVPICWPQNLEVDYFRYYKLATDCGVDLTICTPSSDYSTRDVKKTIITGGGCSSTFNTSDGYTLRATDYIILDAGTTVSDNGSGYFATVITACPQ